FGTKSSHLTARSLPRDRHRGWRCTVNRIVVVLVGLGVAHLFPEHGLGLYLRLGAATLALLLPFAGAGAAETLAWSLGALFVALLATFVAHVSLGLTLILYAVLAVAFALFRQPVPRLPELRPKPPRPALPLLAAIPFRT